MNQNSKDEIQSEGQDLIKEKLDYPEGVFETLHLFIFDKDIKNLWI